MGHTGLRGRRACGRPRRAPGRDRRRGAQSDRSTRAAVRAFPPAAPPAPRRYGPHRPGTAALDEAAEEQVRPAGDLRAVGRIPGGPVTPLGRAGGEAARRSAKPVRGGRTGAITPPARIDPQNRS
ncbi:hypothetical protein GCM10009605_29770 [Nocardiopsis composta]